MSIPAQIALLSALTADLFDAVPHNRMKDVEKSERQSADKIPTEVRERLDTADKLSDQDHETIIDMARQALSRFQPKPEPVVKSWSIPKLGRGWEIDGGGDLPHGFGD